MSDLLLEIGAENIPASYIEPAYRQLCDDAETLLEELRLPFDQIYATGTPRRIVLIVEGLVDRQEEAEETVTGPPVSKAFDESGAPTAAALGFARSQRVDVGRLDKISTPRGDYLGIVRRLECKPTQDLLSQRLAVLVGGLRFPKVMKWETSGVKFARPVRWIVCLYGRKPIVFRFGDVTSGVTSYGRPWVKGERVTVKSAATYHRDLKRLGVIVDDDERRERIRAMAQRAAAKYGLSLIQDPGLLDELTFMVEDPRVIVGEFSREYLTLPPEVVRTAMRSHQRYLALQDRRGRLVPRFVAFLDGAVASPAEVRRGNEKVLRARLEDALFYWKEDIKRGVDGLAAELDRIVFIEGLGTLGEKAARVAELGEAINRVLGDEQRPSALIRRAARLAKADLASEMIKDGKEFTLLQGLIGSHYSRECGEDPEVAEAVDEHYRPRNPGDELPESTLAMIVGVADRVDTITGCFLAGFVPSGSQDPYALRRHANALLRLIERTPSIRVDTLVSHSLELYRRDGYGGGHESAGEAEERLRSFFAARCSAFLKERGLAYDIVDAVAAVSWMQPGVAYQRGVEVARLRGDTVFERLITGVKRVGNILSGEKRTFGAGLTQIREALATGRLTEEIVFETGRFSDASEHDLYQSVKQVVPEVIGLDDRGDIGGVLHALSRLADPIDRFFDDVLVNCDDPLVRENRHNFLASIFALFGRYADFSRIVEDGGV